MKLFVYQMLILIYACNKIRFSKSAYNQWTCQAIMVPMHILHKQIVLKFIAIYHKSRLRLNEFSRVKGSSGAPTIQAGWYRENNNGIGKAVVKTLPQWQKNTNCWEEQLSSVGKNKSQNIEAESNAGKPVKAVSMHFVERNMYTAEHLFEARPRKIVYLYPISKYLHPNWLSYLEYSSTSGIEIDGEECRSFILVLTGWYYQLQELLFD